MKYININKNFLLIFFVIVLLCTSFLSYNKIKYENAVLDTVKLNEVSDNKALAIMLEQNDGSYLESNSDTWPTTGYYYNSTLSGCINLKGEKVPNSLTYDSNNNSIEVSAGSSLKCFVYFSLNQPNP